MLRESHARKTSIKLVFDICDWERWTEQTNGKDERNRQTEKTNGTDKRKRRTPTDERKRRMQKANGTDERLQNH